MTNPRTSTLDDRIEDSNCRSILCDIKPHSSQISIEDMSSLEASCMNNVFLSSSNQQTTMFKNVLYVSHPSANLLSVSCITEQAYGVYFDNF